MSTQSQPPKAQPTPNPKTPSRRPPWNNTNNAPATTAIIGTLSELTQSRQQQQRDLHFAADVDTQYGVEQQPNEGSIAANVEGKSARASDQAGAHAGPVGSALGPGYPASASAAAAGDGGEVRELGRKEVHEWMLGERVGRSPTEPDGDFDGGYEREEEVDAGRAVREGTGSAVVR
ncbi:hypothetical protein ANOM_004079 [Aspergillus nomiae NRRL 13137]|uniref:Uncharacterized protein n=1 Tax=Aspergillus nomiae NRRL (strain ATCC 15546 / NRRL 13137 / CBS 260.88 / M93) TaxID=1509407 RepID=A0A0L1J8B3_ASPN3|nr:uncharacterized protein ANOM_004079 [Aspergillus nomiae NRRL 13137]KNG88041.1 hypothetical protein ANOM_004079 [Aspergillus nomiae NRRL 13137]